MPDGWQHLYVTDKLDLEQGDYGLTREGEWYLCTPGGGGGKLSPMHKVTEHEDGAITVTPSIQDPQTGFHGYLIHGVWTHHNGDPVLA